MWGVYEIVSALVGGTTESTVIRECRRCGTEVTASVDRCPACGATAISEYRIE